MTRWLLVVRPWITRETARFPSAAARERHDAECNQEAAARLGHRPEVVEGEGNVGILSPTAEVELDANDPLLVRAPDAAHRDRHRERRRHEIHANANPVPHPQAVGPLDAEPAVDSDACQLRRDRHVECELVRCTSVGEIDELERNAVLERERRVPQDRRAREIPAVGLIADDAADVAAYGEVRARRSARIGD
jgi:hypothetical protein